MPSPSHGPNLNNSNNLPRKHLPLPTKLVSDIITYIQHNRQYATLANMAQTNSTFYNLVIPKLYETITITETNWSKLKYGCGDIDASRPSLSSQYNVSFARELPGNPNKEGNSTEDPWTRKDRAIEHCLRLIVDVPICDIVYSIQCLADRLPHHRFGKVEEMVITRHGLTNKRISEENRILSSILAPAGRKKTDNDALTTIPNTKRVVLHWPSLNVTYSSVIVMPQINEWCRHRNEQGRTPTRFVVYGINLDGRCESMDAECHFFEFRRSSEYRAPRSRASIAVDFSRWLFDNLGDGSQVNRVIIHPSAVIDKGEEPTGVAEANPIPRRTIERDLKEQVASIRNKNQAEKTILVASIMKKVVFGDGGYDKEEYPVLKPRPVSHLFRTRWITDLVDSRKRRLGRTCDECWRRVRWRGINATRKVGGLCCDESDMMIPIMMFIARSGL
jgi:hypothetical protein